VDQYRRLTNLSRPDRSPIVIPVAFACSLAHLPDAARRRACIVQALT
jgi:hypothetical protein